MRLSILSLAIFNICSAICFENLTDKNHHIFTISLINSKNGNSVKSDRMIFIKCNQRSKTLDFKLNSLGGRLVFIIMSRKK